MLCVCVEGGQQFDNHQLGKEGRVTLAQVQRRELTSTSSSAWVARRVKFASTIYFYILYTYLLCVTLTHSPVYYTNLISSSPIYQSAGYGKRSLSGHEAAPYQMLVDHLAAAASEKEVTFANVSSIECPSKPSDYTCPQVLNIKDKEELKKKLCDYETIITGMISLVPDTEKAQTRCGAMKIEKPVFKNDEDSTELTSKMAVVLGKDCQIESILEGAKVGQPQVHMLIKSSIPSNTKFILADGANMDLLNANLITKDEIASILKQCPKAATN